MSPLIASQNMDDAYIIDDLLSWGAQQQPAAQGQAGSGRQAAGLKANRDTEQHRH